MSGTDLTKGIFGLPDSSPIRFSGFSGSWNCCCCTNASSTLLRRNFSRYLIILRLRSSLFSRFITTRRLIFNVIVHNQITILASLRINFIQISGARAANAIRKDEIARLATAHTVVAGRLCCRDLSNLSPDCISGGRPSSCRLAHLNLNLLVAVLVIQLQRIAGQRNTDNLIFRDSRHHIALNSSVIRHKATNTFLQNNIIL